MHGKMPETSSMSNEFVKNDSPHAVVLGEEKLLCNSPICHLREGGDPEKPFCFK
jgi:hypothetical protein